MTTQASPKPGRPLATTVELAFLANGAAAKSETLGFAESKLRHLTLPSGAPSMPSPKTPKRGASMQLQPPVYADEYWSCTPGRSRKPTTPDTGRYTSPFGVASSEGKAVQCYSSCNLLPKRHHCTSCYKPLQYG